MADKIHTNKELPEGGLSLSTIEFRSIGLASQSSNHRNVGSQTIARDDPYDERSNSERGKFHESDHDRAPSTPRAVSCTHSDERKDDKNAKGDHHEELLPINLPE
jgi:hypothetical protein